MSSKGNDPLFDKFIEHLQLSDVKLLLLKELWGDKDGFPKEWVRSSILLKKSNQKYFDRRLRELRDSGGLDIESKVIESEHCWRLKSASIQKTNDRAYLTAAQKNGLFQKAMHKCAVCGEAMESGIRGLQADHKIPLIKGGTNDLNNWQPLCNECNVAKRGACRGCSLDCNACAWAFPEKVGFNMVIKLPADLRDAISISKIDQERLEQTIISQLRKLLSQTK